jgi:hypothetical protein
LYISCGEFLFSLIHVGVAGFISLLIYGIIGAGIAFYIYSYLQHFLHKVNAIFPKDSPDKEFARFEGWIFGYFLRTIIDRVWTSGGYFWGNTWKVKFKVARTMPGCGFGARNTAFHPCAINLLITNLFIFKQRLFEIVLNQFTNFRN